MNIQSKLIKYPPEHQVIITVRGEVCSKCRHSKSLTETTVYCRACDCKGLSLLSGRCKVRKWLSHETILEQYQDDVKDLHDRIIKVKELHGIKSIDEVGSELNTELITKRQQICNSCRYCLSTTDNSVLCKSGGIKNIFYSTGTCRSRKWPKGEPNHPRQLTKQVLKSKQTIRLTNKQCPGDIVALTAAVRDLQKAHGNNYNIQVSTTCDAIWEHNPHVTIVKNERSVTPASLKIKCEYPGIHKSNQRPRHFIEAFHEDLSRKLNVDIPVTDFKGDIFLSEEEKSWACQVHETEIGHEGPFWIMMAGGKNDFTAKWWNPEFYQQVVDYFSGRITFVQCGEAGHWHPPLNNVINLIGKTNLRQFIRLMYHASGVVCPVTFAMHAAAAVPTKDGSLRPCVVIAGGREPVHWEAYPGHQFLHTIGGLDCCKTGGCWRSRCQKIGDGDAKDNDHLCEYPIQVKDDLSIPKCMMMITPEDVIRSIERYFESDITNFQPITDNNVSDNSTTTQSIKLKADTDTSNLTSSSTCKNKPQSFAWTSPYGGCWAEKYYRTAKGKDHFGTKVKTEQQFRDLLAKSKGHPDLMIMGNFIVERSGIKSVCREYDIDTVHCEDGFFPHYSTIHADPVGFCWESSLTHLTFKQLSDKHRLQAMNLKKGWLQFAIQSLPKEIQTPFVIWPLQLIGDKVNSHGLNVKSWNDLIKHFRSCLPDNFQLVIKPHPRGNDETHKSIGELSKSLTNTHILNKGVDLKTLLANCVAAAGANSTVLHEARLIFNKPVYTYAKSWYTNHDDLFFPVRSEFPPRQLSRIYLLEDASTFSGEYLSDYRDWFLAQLLCRQYSQREAKSCPTEYIQWLHERSFKSYQRYGEEIFY